MASVTTFTAARMQQIENTTVVSGLVNTNGHLILRDRVGNDLDAGYVKGDKGDQGLQGPQGVDGIQGSSATPAGTISLWGSDVAPANWLMCDGSDVSRTTYPSLFAAIGTKYGAGDGTTTFNLPNLKGKAPVGKDAAQTEFANLAQNGGEKTHLLTTNEMPSHIHTQQRNGANMIYVDNTPADANTASNVNRFVQAVGAQGGTLYQASTSAVGGGAAHNVLQPYTVVNFIIKATNGDTPGDSQLTQRVSTLESTISPAILAVRDKIFRLTQVLTGGGLRKVGDGWINWTANFRTMGSGLDDLAPGGYFNISFPPDGTVIPVHGHPTVSSITVASSRITVTSLSGYCALYYDLPIGGSSASQPGRFHLVDYLSGPYTIPSTWILIAARDIDAFQPEWTWGDGMRQDWWHVFVLVNAWVVFSTEYATPAWKRLDTGEILCQGLIKSGNPNLAITAANTGLVGPSNRMIFNQWSNAGSARVDVMADGTLTHNGYTTGGSNAYVSLEGIRWFPTGA
jgi:microcystin-dependent protein